MVRIFAAGDFHSDRAHAKALSERISHENVDLIILNGDIVEEHDAQGVLYHFTKLGKPVLLIPGNHDWFATEFLALQYNVKNLHGTHFVHGDIAIFGCGGANVGMNMLTESELYETIANSHKDIAQAKTKILVTHVHPSDTTMECFSQFIKGSIGVRKAIENIQPTLALCGHVHEAEGIEEKIGKTRVVNVGKHGRIFDI